MTFGMTGWVFLGCYLWVLLEREVGSVHVDRRRRGRDNCQRSCVFGDLVLWIICTLILEIQSKIIVLPLFKERCNSSKWECSKNRSFKRMVLNNTCLKKNWASSFAVRGRRNNLSKRICWEQRVKLRSYSKLLIEIKIGPPGWALLLRRLLFSKNWGRRKCEQSSEILTTSVQIWRRYR